MKTTLDLPNDLVREMKLRAVHEGKKLKEFASEVIRRGLSQQSVPPVRSLVRPSLPLIRCPHPAAKGKDLTPERVAEILLSQELP
jgi:hypothetical protein